MVAVVETLLACKSILVHGWFALFFVGERLLAAAQPMGAWRWDWQRLARNGGLWLINLAGSVALVLPITLWASRHGLGWRPASWGGGAGLAADLLLLDFLLYWWHRANHELPILWRFHEVHHLDRFLDTTSALRFHFGEVLMSAAARALVVVAAAIPLSSVFVFETLVLLAAFFHHSNLRILPRLERALSRVVVTPAIHWVHHHAVKRDTDSNYGTILYVWDMLFGPRNRRPRTLDMEIGAEGRGELPFTRLVLRPFVVRAEAADRLQR